MAFSVLISVYQREKPQYLEQALESLLEQTLLPTEVVIVEDGPLTDELYAVIEAFKTRFAATVSVVLPRNVGLGLALNHGLKECHYPIVARMDSDDICKPRRFEKQLEILRTHKEIDVVGSWIDEFLGTKENIISTRKVPETHQEILHFADTVVHSIILRSYFVRKQLKKWVVIGRLDLKIMIYGYVRCKVVQSFITFKKVSYGFDLVQKRFIEEVG